VIAPAAKNQAPARRLLLDASVWVAAETPEERSAVSARELVVDADRRTAALDLTLYEVANAIGVKRGEVVEAVAACYSIELRCGGHLVRIDAELLERIVEIADQYGLTSYDAAYVAVARHHGWQLVSTDIEDLVSKGLAITPDAAV
jgi:predicted nucleic acid-binding protein